MTLNKLKSNKYSLVDYLGDFDCKENADEVNPLMMALCFTLKGNTSLDIIPRKKRLVNHSLYSKLVIHLIGMRIFWEMSRACAIDSPVAFLTGNHMVQIRFDQISLAFGSSIREISERDYRQLSTCRNLELAVELFISWQLIF